MTINTATRSMQITDPNIDFSATIQKLAAEWQQSIDVFMVDGRWVGTCSPNGNIVLAQWAKHA